MWPSRAAGSHAESGIGHGPPDANSTCLQSARVAHGGVQKKSSASGGSSRRAMTDVNPLGREAVTVGRFPLIFDCLQQFLLHAITHPQPPRCSYRTPEAWLRLMGQRWLRDRVLLILGAGDECAVGSEAARAPYRRLLGAGQSTTLPRACSQKHRQARRLRWYHGGKPPMVASIAVYVEVAEPLLTRDSG
jgi:hypothetical protein